MLEAAARRPRDRDELVDRLRDGGFCRNGVAVCPPVVEYSRELQACADGESVQLPDSSAVVEMMSDYVVMRKQACACL